MSRAWGNNANPDGTRKHRVGIHGTEKETDELTRKGFDAVSSANGDRYYYSPSKGLIWLFPDITWYGERISPGQTLAEYLSIIPDLEIEERLFSVAQTENGMSTDLGIMDGVELTAHVSNRLGDDGKALAMISQLLKKDSIKIEYRGALGAAATVEIHRMVFRPDTRTGADLLPRKGDTFINGLTVDYTSQADGVVLTVEKPDSPIPLGNVAPTKRPGVWKLVGIKSTDDDGEDV